MKVPKFQARKTAAATWAVAAALLLAAAAMAQDNSSPPSPGAPAALVAVSPPADFSLDPFFVSLQGGGHVDAGILDKACSGYVPTTPSVAFDYQGDGDQLRTFFYSDGDPVLVVQNPGRQLPVQRQYQSRSCSIQRLQSLPRPRDATPSGSAAGAKTI